jgi:hypothetical protein
MPILNDHVSTTFEIAIEGIVAVVIIGGIVIGLNLPVNKDWDKPNTAQTQKSHNEIHAISNNEYALLSSPSFGRGGFIVYMEYNGKIQEFLCDEFSTSFAYTDGHPYLTYESRAGAVLFDATIYLPYGSYMPRDRRKL